MYLQVTTRCNMSREHCCMRATAKGEDMSMKVLKAALEYCDGYPTMGGGEPTLHPKFWEMFGVILGHPNVEQLLIVTNGSKTEIALALCNLAKKGVLCASLSIDVYHDPIDHRVEEAFKQGMNQVGAGRWRLPDPGYGKTQNDLREIRDTTEDGTALPFAAGRAADWGREGCCCSDVIVKPNGDVYLCGCDDAPKIGDVFNGFERPETDEGDLIDCVRDVTSADQIYG